MSELVIEFIRAANITQLIAIGIMFWFFYRRLDTKLEKCRVELKEDISNFKQEVKQDTANFKQEVKQDTANFKQEVKQDIVNFRQEVKQDIANLSNRIDKLVEKVEDVDRRLCRIEGSMSIHGHCLFNQSHTEKKAE